MPVQVSAVSEVLQTVRALHQLLLEVDGLLVSVCVRFEGEAGGALRAQVACWCGFSHCGAVGRLKVEMMGLRVMTGLGRLVVRTLDAWPVKGQSHQR